ncbi:hypothetical protein ACQEVS_25805 [Streptomyces sp. CA-181903]|uniref:hypothetical protein n=1 Tax=Streptomyces sp. CA-181903 TaxID=3240055 RepID=UPI003D8FFEBB
MSTAEPELTASQNAPADPARAQALATALGLRAALDAQFRRDLDEWWQRAHPVVTGGGNVRNYISGGTQDAPIFQGRDFSSSTIHHTFFGAPTAQWRLTGRRQRHGATCPSRR